MSRGVLLLNLGSPDSTNPADVRRYLREFLSDDRVLDMPKLVQQAVLNLFILPFRPKKSAAAYAKVWTPEGSPLLVHSRALAKAVGEELGLRPVRRLRRLLRLPELRLRPPPLGDIFRDAE